MSEQSSNSTQKEEMILGKFYWRLNDHENVSIPVSQRYNKGVYP